MVMKAVLMMVALMLTGLAVPASAHESFVLWSHVAGTDQSEAWAAFSVLNTRVAIQFEVTD